MQCKYLVNNVFILRKIYYKVVAYVNSIKNFSKLRVSKVLASKRKAKYNIILNYLIDPEEEKKRYNFLRFTIILRCLSRFSFINSFLMPLSVIFENTIFFPPLT